jgi:aspartate/methionine/tyrosine aminotransferase
LDEVTLCPSVSCANLALLCAMKRRGIHRIVFETPAYFATIEQARMLGFDVVRVPSARANGFEVPIDVFVALARAREHSAVWLTQPRFGIGTDQSLQRIQALGAALGHQHSLVLDEAGEQRHPSTLCTIGSLECDVARTRGLVKGIGLNGLRISFILHPRHWREDLERVLETAGASIDRYSLIGAADLASSANLLPSLLAAANDQVCSLRRQLEVQLLGGWAVPTPLHNSYIGTVILDLSDLPGSYMEQRVALLEECRDLAMPVVLRASIGFAFDPSWEGVRINYFTPAENVVETARLLNEAWVGVQRRLTQA